MTRKRLRFLAPLFAVALVAAAACQSDGDGDGGGDVDPGEFPREETLFTTGTEWGTYANWNPFTPSGYATGAMGLIYEPLFLFNPHTVELEPWLAESGEWVSDNEFVITLREGVTWHDGEPFTAEDVKFTFDLREFDTISYSNLDDWVEEVTTEGDNVVRVTFSDPRKGEWDNFLYRRWIGPEHLWADLRGEEIANEAGTHSVTGTGSYKYVRHDENRAVYERNDEWWGIDALGLEMGPRYIVDLGNASTNDVAQVELLAGNIDLSNNFLPPETVLDNEEIEAYRDEQPLMIAWNTAYLIPNHTRPPMDDPDFRRAMAFAINTEQIVEDAYQGMVEVANPTGLLPTWTEQGMVDQDVLDEWGFSYNPEEANRILDEAGYEYDGDWRTTPDGDPIELTVIVPQGWTDWNIAAEIIAESLQAVGINVVTDFPEAATVDELRNTGDFDLVVNNWTDLENHPYETYYYLFRLPIQDRMDPDNFQRYENQEAWELAQEFAKLSVSERDAEFDELHAQLQEIALRDMPAIPMWYNGLWSQWNTTYWTGWPKDDPNNPGPFPSLWGGALEKGSIYMFAQLRPAG